MGVCKDLLGARGVVEELADGVVVDERHLEGVDDLDQAARPALALDVAEEPVQKGRRDLSDVLICGRGR